MTDQPPENRPPSRDGDDRPGRIRESGEARLPPPRRNFMLAIVAALIVFVLLVAVRVLSEVGGEAPTPRLPGEAPATEEPQPAN